MRYTVTTFKVRLEVADPGPPSRSSEDVCRFSHSIFKDLDADKEHFVLLVLNNKNRVNGFKVISTGTLTTCLEHPREVYSTVLCPEWRAAAIVFLHNHPSGDPAPSQEDQEITRRLKEIGDLFGIKVLDHVIVGHERFFSFADKGLL
jgi:DNA repair protein RadC